MAGDVALLEEFRPADQFVERADAECGHVAARFLGHGGEVVDDHFRRALEFGAEFRVGGGHADGAGVEVALADIDAAHGDHGGGAEVELLRAEDGGDDHIAAVADAAVRAECHAIAQVVDQQSLLGLSQAEFPGGAGVFGGRKRGRAGAAVVAGDQDVVRGGLGHARCHGADSGFRDQFHGNPCARVHLLEVVDELGEILDRVNVVVGRGGNELHAGLGVAQSGDQRVHLVAGELASFAGFGSLGHFDLQFVRIHEVVGRDSEAPGGDLLDVGAGEIAIRIGLVARGILAAFA